MSDYIRREDAIDLINKISNLDIKAKGGICVSLINLKKADVAPVRHARWRHYEGMYACEDCGAQLDDESPFCPMCGAKMDGGE